MSGLLTQAGVKDEAVFGTPLTVDRFFEYTTEGIQLDVQRIESSALRATTRVQRSDRFAVNRKGAAGAFTTEVLTKGFGWWLKHMLGTVATAGPTDLKYTHTGTVASLAGKSFCLQVNRPFVDGSAQAFTYEGGKVASWELSNSVDGLLMLTLNLDFEDETTASALATASYPTATELFSFVGGAVTVGGASFDVVRDVTVTCDNGLKTDRHFIRSSSLKKEQLEAALRNITFSLTADWDSMAQYNRYVSATAAGTLAQIVLTWQGPTLIGTASYPTFTVTIPAARFDGSTPNVGGPDLLEQSLSGRALFDGTNSAITVAYGTADATP